MQIQNWNFQRDGEGVQPRKLHCKGYGYFLEQHGKRLSINGYKKTIK